MELRAVRLPLVSFRHTFVFDADGATLVSDSTLRFRDRTGIAESLRLAGFRLREVRDAPDRPGLEFVFIAQRARSGCELTRAVVGVPGWGGVGGWCARVPGGR
jgi:hypothetical protein